MPAARIANGKATGSGRATRRLPGMPGSRQDRSRARGNSTGRARPPLWTGRGKLAAQRRAAQVGAQGSATLRIFELSEG